MSDYILIPLLIVAELIIVFFFVALVERLLQKPKKTSKKPFVTEEQINEGHLTIQRNAIEPPQGGILPFASGKGEFVPRKHIYETTADQKRDARKRTTRKMHRHIRGNRNG
jgi:hypothetical protein